MIFNQYFADNLIVSLSISFEYQNNKNIVEEIKNLFENLVKIFIKEKDVNWLEHILLAIMRLTGLDSIMRKLN